MVLSGGYEDDDDEGANDNSEIVYTGQGGNDLLHTKCQISDQILERGNLALVGSHKIGRPVRVTRKNASKSSYTGSVFTYDGLWDVKEWWEEKGIAGFTVFKYRLRQGSVYPHHFRTLKHIYISLNFVIYIITTTSCPVYEHAFTLKS